MKLIAYILLGVAVLLSVIALVFIVKIGRDKRVLVLEHLERARTMKAAKKAESERLSDIESEINSIENSNNVDHASEKKIK